MRKSQAVTPVTAVTCENVWDGVSASLLTFAEMEAVLSERQTRGDGLC